MKFSWLIQKAPNDLEERKIPDQWLKAWMWCKAGVREQHLHRLQWQRLVSHCTQALREGAQTRTDSVAKLHIRVDVIQHSAAKREGLSTALLCLPGLVTVPGSLLSTSCAITWLDTEHIPLIKPAEIKKKKKKSLPFWLSFELNLLSTRSVKHNKKGEPVQQRTRGWRQKDKGLEEPRAVPFCNV